MLREGLFDHHRRDQQPGLANATPAADTFLGPVPEGYVWYLENHAFFVGGNTHTAAVDLLVVTDNGQVPAAAIWDRGGLVQHYAAAVENSVNFGVAIYVPPGHWIMAHAGGGTLAQGDSIVHTFQVAVHQLNPHFIMSPDDTLQVKRAHERLGAELNMDAVGGRAN